MLCKTEGLRRIYHGETHRAFWDRAQDHYKALLEQDQKYGVVKHWMEAHGELEEPPPYEFKLTKTNQASAHRQISDALDIGG